MEPGEALGAEAETEMLFPVSDVTVHAVGMVCESACVSLRPCLCITKPILGVQVWPGVARQRFRV